MCFGLPSIQHKLLCTVGNKFQLTECFVSRDFISKILYRISTFYKSEKMCLLDIQ